MGAADQARLETEGWVRREGAVVTDSLDAMAKAVGGVAGVTVCIP